MGGMKQALGSTMPSPMEPLLCSVLEILLSPCHHALCPSKDW